MAAGVPQPPPLREEGVSAAQLIREATISWLAYLDGQGARDELEQRVARIEQRLGP